MWTADLFYLNRNCPFLIAANMTNVTFQMLTNMQNVLASGSHPDITSSLIRCATNEAIEHTTSLQAFKVILYDVMDIDIANFVDNNIWNIFSYLL